MKKIVFQSKYNAVLQEVEDRMPERDEIRLKLCYSALSAGTERASITGNEDGGKGFEYKFPCSSGYSGSGIITHVGENVTEFKVGDRVMVHGAGHKQYATLNKKEAILLPEEVDLKQAAMVIVAGFSLSAVRKAQVKLGESMLVVGLGLLGLYSIKFAHLSGAYPIIAADFNPERRKLAKQMGADYVLDPSDENYVETVRKLTDGGVSSAIEVTGNPKALSQTLHCTAKFGKVILLGCTRTFTQVDFYNDVHRPGIELIGAHSGARPQLETHSGVYTEMDDCRVILKYLAAKKLDFSDMINEVCSPADAHAVYERLVYDKNFPLGVIFDWGTLD